MTKCTSIIAVITARGGSKKLPGKNIVDLGGKPLLAYTIEAGLESHRIDRLVLSTDSEGIAEVGRRCGAEVPFLRPAHLATDTAHSPDVVEHAVDFLERAEGAEFSHVIMLQPTSPFRTSRHIDDAVDAFEKTDYDSYITVRQQEHPPWWSFLVENGQLKTACPWEPGVNVFNLERQQFPPVYVPNGAFYITARDYLRRTLSIVNPDSCGALIMNEDDSMDIDTAMDLAVAQQRIHHE